MVRSLMWKWFVAGWWSPSPVVQQRRWIMRGGRQAALHLSPCTVKVICVRNTFSGLKVLKMQTAPLLTRDRVIVLEDRMKKKNYRSSAQNQKLCLCFSFACTAQSDGSGESMSLSNWFLVSFFSDSSSIPNQWRLLVMAVFLLCISLKECLKNWVLPLQGDTCEACRSVCCTCAANALENHSISNNAPLAGTFLLAQLQA